jgi:hypothetical protein
VAHPLNGLAKVIRKSEGWAERTSKMESMYSWLSVSGLVSSNRM